MRLGLMGFGRRQCCILGGDSRKKIGQRYMKFLFEKHKLLVLLLIGDILFLILHLVHTYTALLPDFLFSILVDRGYAEFYQYMKELWILILFLILGINRRNILFLILSLLFLYFLIDDSLELHERIGAFLAVNLNFQPMFGLRDVDFGELAVFLFFGLQFLLLIGAAYIHSDAFSRVVLKNLLLMLAFLAFFGVIIDMVQITVLHPVAYNILGMVDDGGELIVMSLITAYVFHLHTVEINGTYP